MHLPSLPQHTLPTVFLSFLLLGSIAKVSGDASPQALTAGAASSSSSSSSTTEEQQQSQQQASAERQDDDSGSRGRGVLFYFRPPISDGSRSLEKIFMPMARPTEADWPEKNFRGYAYAEEMWADENALLDDFYFGQLDFADELAKLGSGSGSGSGSRSSSDRDIDSDSDSSGRSGKETFSTDIAYFTGSLRLVAFRRATECFFINDSGRMGQHQMPTLRTRPFGPGDFATVDGATGVACRADRATRLGRFLRGKDYAARQEAVETFVQARFGDEAMKVHVQDYDLIKERLEEKGLEY